MKDRAWGRVLSLPGWPFEVKALPVRLRLVRSRRWQPFFRRAHCGAQDRGKGSLRGTLLAGRLLHLRFLCLYGLDSVRESYVLLFRRVPPDVLRKWRI